METQNEMENESQNETQSQNESDDFLQELNSDQFIVPNPVQDKKQEKEKRENEKMLRKMMIQEERDSKKVTKQLLMDEKKNKTVKKIEKEEDGEITPIYGKDKLVLLQKINQYRSLFPEKLGKFKIKKNPTVDDLQTALIEMQCLIEINGVNGFVLDSFFQIVKSIEGYTYDSEYDLSGLSILLQSNKEFCNLLKILLVKYGCFSSIPSELQVILIIGTTAMICINKNNSKHTINNYLDQKF